VKLYVVFKISIFALKIISKSQVKFYASRRKILAYTKNKTLKQFRVDLLNSLDLKEIKRQAFSILKMTKNKSIWFLFHTIHM
jgi:hypothetical protein